VRKIIALSILSVFAGCTVVPDPTATGATVAATDSSIVGSWVATSYATTTSGSVLITSTYSHQLVLASASHRYQRWVFDSTPGTSTHPALIENGSWSLFTRNDSARLVLLPVFRQLTLVTANSPDTFLWTLSSSTLRLVGPRWNKRDSIETLNWTAAN